MKNKFEIEFKVAVSELKNLNPTQRHVFFDNFKNSIPGIICKKHLYESLGKLPSENLMICRDPFANKMYLMELIKE